MRIHAGCSELGKISKKHYLIGSVGDSPSHYLLLFYAAECRLKSIYKKKCRVSRTSDIIEKEPQEDHNLAAWAKAVKLPAQAVGENPTFRLKRDGPHGGRFPISVAHQAWRYGIHMNDEDERTLKDWLKQLNEKLEEISR